MFILVLFWSSESLVFVYGLCPSSMQEMVIFKMCTKLPIEPPIRNMLYTDFPLADRRRWCVWGAGADCARGICSLLTFCWLTGGGDVCGASADCAHGICSLLTFCWLTGGGDVCGAGADSTCRCPVSADPPPAGGKSSDGAHITIIIITLVLLL
jgi:hypothetical protein